MPLGGQLPAYVDCSPPPPKRPCDARDDVGRHVVEEVERCLEGFGSAARVMTVTLEVGGLRAVVPSSFLLFEVASSGTRPDGARSIIEEIPWKCAVIAASVSGWCAASISMPTCEGPVKVSSGKELLLRAIEVDDGTDQLPQASPGR